MILTDADILTRLTAVEDGTTERKPLADSRGWCKTAVAFSNSLAVGQPGVLFVGVNDSGTVQDKSTNFEDLQKKVSGELSNIYPPINPTILVREKDGRRFLAVIIYGSPNRPHFAGKCYVRNGTRTDDASEEEFQRLIAARTGKVGEILKWKGKEITLRKLHPEKHHENFGRVRSNDAKRIYDCNQHWVTLQALGNSPALEHYPLEDVTLSSDTMRLVLIVEY